MISRASNNESNKREASWYEGEKTVFLLKKLKKSLYRSKVGSLTVLQINEVFCLLVPS